MEQNNNNNNKVLSAEEKINRIEQAPVEMQTRVAKAYIRDDISDEDVQYLFNTDSMEEMNEKDIIIENINKEEPEGIGSIEFTIRTAKPKNNKNYITTGFGGWNTCIKGNPTDKNANVLANCVGYASGRFNEVINECRGTTGCTYKKLNCNAENFIERAESAGLKIGTEPKKGAIAVWQKGSLSSGDGAGHVEYVEDVYNNNEIYTSASNYGGTAFMNCKRNNNNGRWGLSSSYKFRGFIYSPEDVENWIYKNEVKLPKITAQVERDTSKNQLIVNELMNIRTDIETTSQSLGTVNKGAIFNWYEEKQGKASKWYSITEDNSQWIAGINNNGHKYCEIYYAEDNNNSNNNNQETTTIITTPLKIGDKVKIIGTGNGSSYGTSNTAYGIGWERQILRILKGREFPYQVGNNSGTTGFYKAEALEKR